jgi:hypothetical protein
MKRTTRRKRAAPVPSPIAGAAAAPRPTAVPRPVADVARAERLGHRFDVLRKALVNAPHMKSMGSWSATKDGKGRVTKVEAEDLQLRNGWTLPGTGHNPPKRSPKGWSWLNANDLTHGNGPPNYVRMHMLNGQLGGPGNDADNLAPGTASLNSHHEKHFESEAKYWLNIGGEIEKYTVNVTYQPASGSLGSNAAKKNWRNTVADVDGEFDFIHYKGKKRARSTAPFSAEENAGLDGKNNWLGF